MMKKLILAGLFLSSLFGNSLEDRVKILEEKVSKLEKKLNIVNNNQKTLKRNIVNNTALKCDKLKLVKYSYEYEDSGFIRSYNFKYTIKNEYDKPIKYIFASVGFIDNDEIKMLEDYVKKTITIKPHQEKVVKTNYLIDDGSLSETLKDTPKEKMRTEFKIFKIKFSDGTILKCN